MHFWFLRTFLNIFSLQPILTCNHKNCEIRPWDLNFCKLEFIYYNDSYHFFNIFVIAVTVILSTTRLGSHMEIKTCTNTARADMHRPLLHMSVFEYAYRYGDVCHLQQYFNNWFFRGRRGRDRMQSVPITTKVARSNPFHGEDYSIHYVIKLVSDLRQVCGFLRVLQFQRPIKLTATI